MGGWPASAQEHPAACPDDADSSAEDLAAGTGASCADGQCSVFVVDCVPGYVCCGNGACCPGEASAGCASDAERATGCGNPCEGARCEAGQCVVFLASCAPGFACCGNGACCRTDGGCASDADCPPWTGDPCTTARCLNGACVPHRLACAPGSRWVGGSRLPTGAPSWG